MAWSQRQVQLFVAEVRREVGNGWSWLVPRVRAALVAEKAFAVARAQNADTVAIKSMDVLLAAMFVEAGLAEEDDGSFGGID